MLRLLFHRSALRSFRSPATGRFAPLWRCQTMTTNSYSLNALKRWSSADNDLPTVDKIKAIHVYDFDNTLFASPLPNRQLWQGLAIGLLQTQETFISGGWWHDPNILKCTGEGMEIEEPRAWRGWWNEQIVDLVNLSMKQKDALNVLLTGRTEKGFADIIQRMAKSKGLEFDMVVLRPEIGPSNQKFSSTMKFKQAFLEALVYSYTQADNIRIYEDRPRHVQGFRDYFVQMNQTLSSDAAPISRKPITAEVVEVTEKSTVLDPVTECAEVQRLINAQNVAFRNGSLPEGAAKAWEIKKQVFFTGYLLSSEDSDRLLEAANFPKHNPNAPPSDLRTLANSIIITPRPCPPHILDRVGGMGKKLRWRATATGSFEDKVYAAKVEPVPSTASFYSESKIPMVVLALRGTGKPVEANRITHWTPLAPERAIEFDTVVAEKVLLRIEQERAPQDDQDRGFKRPRLQDENFPPLGAQPGSGNAAGGGASRGPANQNQKRAYHNGENRRPDGPRGGSSGGVGSGQRSGNTRPGGAGPGGAGSGAGGSGARGNFQRGRAGGEGRGRGRGGYPGYRSLDDEARRKGNSFGTDGANDGGLSY